MQPLVSIIIPTYNRAHLLGETLDSVLAQTYTYWECFIVDDGSTDNTEQFVRSYCEIDKRFQFYKRPENRPKGANACRNYGFELSKGEYMNWFDDDDIMVKDKIMKQTKQLLDSDLNFTVCQTLIFKGDLSNVLGLRKGKLKSDNFFNDFITNKIKWLTQAPLLKRKYLIDNDLSFDESLQQYQERDFFIKCLAVIKDYLINEEPLVYFRLHENSISHSELTIEKLYSQFYVNYNALINHKHLLDSSSEQYLKKELKSAYRKIILISKGQSKKIKNMLFDNRVGLSFKDKVRLTIGWFSLKIFNKGELFFR